MHSCWLAIFALVLPLQVSVTSVSGQILDRLGDPVSGARVVYQQIGTIDRNYRLDAGMLAESPAMREGGTGHTYQTRTDRKGSFVINGVAHGVYQVEITAADGKRVYSGRKTIVDNGEPSAQNILNVDLSLAEGGPQVPGAGTNLASGRKSKAQLDLIRHENARAEKINRTLGQYHAALAVQDWSAAIVLVQRLIELDPNRWEFYQNLGTLQSNRLQYQDAAESYLKGVEVARRMLANPSDTDRALTTIGEMLIAEADCNARLQKIPEAVALLDQAAAVHPHPFMAHYRACNLLSNQEKPERAIEECNRAIADDPAQWGPYQLLGGIFVASDQPKDAAEAYGRGAALAEKLLEQKKDSLPERTGLGQMLNAQGNVLLQIKRHDEAIVAFSRAAEVSAYPAMPYFNLCATFYNLKRTQEAMSACEKAISSDPKMADAYYIRGTILFGQGRSQHGKYVIPQAAVESLEKYLAYAPGGEHVQVVRQMLKQAKSAN